MIKNIVLVMLLTFIFVIISKPQVTYKSKISHEKVFEKLCGKAENKKVTLSMSESFKFNYSNDVAISIILENKGNEDIGFIRDNTLENFQIFIKDSKGKEIDFSKEKANVKSEPTIYDGVMLISLRPSEKYTFDISLPEYIILKKGTYKISFKRLLLKADKQSLFCVQSNESIVKIN
jgi:hypothetical protein